MVISKIIRFRTHIEKDYIFNNNVVDVKTLLMKWRNV